jgi:hypothetical protein
MASPKGATEKKPSTSVYIPSDIRSTLENLALEIGYKRSKSCSASFLVQYLIQTYGEQAKEKLISQK